MRTCFAVKFKLRPVVLGVQAAGPVSSSESASTHLRSQQLHTDSLSLDTHLPSLALSGSCSSQRCSERLNRPMASPKPPASPLPPPASSSSSHTPAKPRRPSSSSTPRPRFRASSSVNPDQFVSHEVALTNIRTFMKGRSSYDVFPVSFRLIVLDTKLMVKKALGVMWQNGQSSLHRRGSSVFGEQRADHRLIYSFRSHICAAVELGDVTVRRYVYLFQHCLNERSGSLSPRLQTPLVV